MIFIWQRFGFLVPVIGIGMLVLTQLLLNALFGDGTYERNSDMYSVCATLASAAAIYWLSVERAKHEKPRTLVDPETSEQVTIHSTSTFFFIPLRIWPFIFIGLAIVMVIANFTK